MKKILVVLFLIFAIQIPSFASSYLDKQIKEAKKNVKYSTTNKHVKKLPKHTITAPIKDPKLIQLSSKKIVIDDAAYEKKLQQDESVYTSKIMAALKLDLKTYATNAPAEKDFYNVYRIAERIIRANNLDYVNWRVAIRLTPADYNAAATSANLVLINTALYDSLRGNDDALAFVIAHEMAHLLLGHQQRILEMARTYEKLRKYEKEYSGTVEILAYKVQEKRLQAESRTMEFVADAEGAVLMTRAGYDMDKGIQALNFINALPHIKTWNDSHPTPEKRIESMIENISAFDPNWVNEGKNNILHSNVLDCTKSSDRVSIVISKSPNVSKTYQPENIEQKILRIAYASYQNGKMVNAIKYFEKYADINESYIPYLYISYANEYLYNTTKQEKYLKQAKKAIEKAVELEPDNKFVVEQVEAL